MIISRNFFSRIVDDFSYELPSSLQLSKDEIDIFATRWSNPAPLECNDDFDVSLEIIPGMIFQNVLESVFCLYRDDLFVFLNLIF